MMGNTLFPPVNISAAKIAASDAATFVSTVAERPVARHATGVFTTSTENYASTATIGGAMRRAASTEADCFARNLR